MSFSRSYRPQSFEKVIGQDIFVKLLRNGLHREKLSQSLLFSGMHGIGKTTLARLVAKARLCSAMTMGDACEICESCKAFQKGAHMDFLELDAAANTSIEDIRPLLENAAYYPFLSAHKVILMDEVHMLSKSAFNALLKMVEEPPPHVQFIFATTELQKIPATLLSRCQQLHLKPISQVGIERHLREICLEKKIAVGQESLELIAFYSEGSMRDAFSLLESALLSMEEGEVLSVERTSHLLGIPNKRHIKTLIDALWEKQEQALRDGMNTLFQQGFDAAHLLHGILHYLHDLLQENSTSHRDQGLVHQWWQIAYASSSTFKAVPFPTMVVEMALLRMLYVGSLHRSAHPIHSTQLEPPKERDHNPNGSGSPEPFITPSRTSPKDDDSSLASSPIPSSLSYSSLKDSGRTASLKRDSNGSTWTAQARDSSPVSSSFNVTLPTSPSSPALQDSGGIRSIPLHQEYTLEALLEALAPHPSLQKPLLDYAFFHYWRNGELSLEWNGVQSPTSLWIMELEAFLKDWTGHHTVVLFQYKRSPHNRNEETFKGDPLIKAVTAQFPNVFLEEMTDL